LFLRIFEAIPGTLKPFRMLKYLGNPLEMVGILYENPIRKCLGGGGIFSKKPFLPIGRPF